MDLLDRKLNILRDIIREKRELAVAFSGGIDSSLIAMVAYQELKMNSAAVTIDSDVFSGRELDFSRRIAEEIGIKHVIVQTSELENPEFVANSSDRCYYCKHEEIEVVRRGADSVGLKIVAFGVNVSDFGEHRPGIKALKEAGIFMPLLEADISKKDIPEIAKKLGLSNYDMPSTTCLASRVPYGETITSEKLKRIENSENYLSDLGVSMSRVRVHGHIARIEVPDSEFRIVAEHREEIYKSFREFGFSYVSLDLKGYVSGSMNLVLDQKRE